MKAFTPDNTETWGEKVNFVDINNVFVGYDMSQNCCEHADWFISPSITPWGYIKEEELKTYSHEELEPYIFDPSFFMRVADSNANENLDAGAQIAFRLVAPNQPDLFLQIFNSHNGYYGHGFTVEINNVKVGGATL